MRGISCKMHDLIHEMRGSSISYNYIILYFVIRFIMYDLVQNTTIFFVCICIINQISIVMFQIQFYFYILYFLELMNFLYWDNFVEIIKTIKL